jgi:hypothetical protein
MKLVASSGDFFVLADYPIATNLNPETLKEGDANTVLFVFLGKVFIFKYTQF